jgi:cytochrome c-type biogenesis protein CcmE
VSSKRSPARLVIALSVAAALGIFILYTSAFANSTPSLKPSQLAGHHGDVSLVGTVVGPVTGDAHAGGLRFRVRDIGGSAAIPIVYRGEVPDLFKAGRHIVVNGKVEGSRFVADPGSLVTKCPSKYAPASSSKT